MPFLQLPTFVKIRICTNIRYLLITFDQNITRRYMEMCEKLIGELGDVVKKMKNADIAFNVKESRRRGTNSGQGKAYCDATPCDAISGEISIYVYSTSEREDASLGISFACALCQGLRGNRDGMKK